MVGLRSVLWVGYAFVCDLILDIIDGNSSCGTHRQAIEQVLLCKDDRNAAIINQHSQTLLWKLGIKWKVRSSSFENCKECYNHLQRTLHGYTNDYFWSYDELSKIVCELISSLV